MQGCKQRLFTKYPPIFSFYPDCENWLEGKAASRGADKKMCTPVLFIFTLIARLQAEVVQQISSSSLFSSLFILIVFKVDRLRREGEEGRRRSSSQEAHYRTTEQVGFFMVIISTEYTCFDMGA